MSEFDWKQIRTDHGLSQQKLADKLGLPKQTYVHYEKNNRYPKDVVQKLHQIFQIEPPISQNVELLKSAYMNDEINVENFSKQSQTLFEETGDTDLGIMTVEAYIKQEAYDKAIEFSRIVGRRIVDGIRYSTPKDAEFLAKLHYLRGNGYYNRKRYVAAYEQLLIAEEILERVDPYNFLLTRIRQNIAIMMNMEDRVDEASRYFEKVEEAYKDATSIEVIRNRTRIMGWREFMRGRTFQNNGEYEQALECYKRAKDFYEETNAANADENIRCMIHSIAEMEYKLGRYENSINLCLKGMEEENRADLWVDFLEILSFSYIETDQFEKAKQISSDILNRPEVGSISIARAYRMLARLYKKQNLMEKANGYFSKAIDQLYANRLEGSTKTILIEITHEYIEANKIISEENTRDRLEAIANPERFITTSSC